MEEQLLETPLPVDINEQEYQGYLLLLSRVSGAMRVRPFSTASCLLVGAAMLALGGYEWVSEAFLDWLTWLFGVLFVIAGIVVYVTIPWRVRRHAAAQYRESVAGGYCFYGTLEVYADRVEKHGMSVTTAIPADPSAFLVESPDVMIWGGAGRRCIVMPARCMTAAAATAVRQVAERLPARNRRFYGRMQARGETVERPVPVEQPVLWECTVHYTAQEYADLAIHAATQSYLRRLPLFPVISGMIGLMLGWTDEVHVLSCVLYFLLAMGLLTVLNLVFPRRRIRHMAEVADAPPPLTVRLSPIGLRIGDGQGEMNVPWSAVDHVIDRGDYVEICKGIYSYRIPKRCIEDLDAFDGLITAHWKKQ